MTEPELAKRFYVTEPSRGVFIVCLQESCDGELRRLKISKDQLGNFLVDGAGMALRGCSQNAAIRDVETIAANVGAA